MDIHALDVITYDGTCVRRKERRRCEKSGSRCFYKNWYVQKGLPCPYFLADDRGFDGELDHVDGVRIHKERFFLPSIASLSFCFFISLAFLGTSATDNRRIYAPQDALRAVLFVLPIAFLFCSLHFLFSRFLGRTVCVLNESGVYFNERFLNWSDISAMRFCVDAPNAYRSPLCCSTLIISGLEEFRLPLTPPRLLLLAKKYSPALDVGIEKHSAVVMLLLFVALPAIASIFIVLA